MRTALRTAIVRVVLPIAVGGLIYTTARPGTVIFLWVREQLGSFPRLEFEGPIWSAIVYNLPDGLWLYAGLSLLCLIWRTFVSDSALTIILSGATVFMFMIEIAQLRVSSLGTFDFMDLVAYAIAFGIVLVQDQLITLYARRDI